MLRMATKMRFLSGRLPRVAVCYNGGFQAFRTLLQKRGLASRNGDGGSGGSANRNEPVVVFEARRDQPDYPESEIFVKTHDDKFGQRFRHLPMPGNVTTTQHFLEVKEKISVLTPKTASCFDQSDVMNTTTTHDRQMGTLHTFSEASRRLPPSNDPTVTLSLPSNLECAAQPCPELARHHFVDLFPSRDIRKGTLTVMTLTQRTENDMSEFTEVVDLEREDMTIQFISTARAICESLQREGYWADFIDPTSGRPYLGPFTNATLFETDERYRHFGFTIEDLGCCKVIRHPVWKTHAFVGSIFSDAPLDSTIVQILMPQQNHDALAPPTSSSSAEEILAQQQQNANACSNNVEQSVEQTMDAETPPEVARKIKKNGDIRVLKRDDKC